VNNAKSFYKAAGRRIALAEFTNRNGMFVQDEMYIYVLNQKGTMLAHGINEKFEGEDFIDLMDSDGKKFIKEVNVGTPFPACPCPAGWKARPTKA
jgi:hypothetical protein